MKLLLCSTAQFLSIKLLEKFLKLLIKPIKENKIIILSTDTALQKHQENLELLKQLYLKQGFTENTVTIYNLVTDKIPSFDDLDVLHMFGGNPFQYMKQIREAGLMQEIRDFVKRDGLYIGTSAGSMIMCPDVDENFMLPHDFNHFGLEDVSGFGYVDFYIIPHWETLSKENREKFEAYSEKYGKKIIQLTDKQGIHVHDAGYDII
jgi:peptidase E